MSHYQYKVNCPSAPFENTMFRTLDECIWANKQTTSLLNSETGRNIFSSSEYVLSKLLQFKIQSEILVFCTSKTIKKIL